jgi:hypothetical protein
VENYQLGHEVLDAAEAHRDNFAMFTWCETSSREPVTTANATGCGTTLCLGGWTMVLAGYTCDPQTGNFTRPDGTVVDGAYGTEAARLLGMTKEEECEGGVAEIWYDTSETRALSRLRAVVERSEREAALA